MISAVQLEMTMVSMRMRNACRIPVFTGVVPSAAAAAQGAEPEPASLEKSPRLIPFSQHGAETAGCHLSETESFSEKIREKTPGS